MDFRFSPEDDAFRQELRAFLQAEWSGGTGDAAVDSDEEYERERAFEKKLAQRGWLTLAWPVEYGGLGATNIRQAIMKEECSYARAPIGGGPGGQATGLVGPAVMAHGTEEQKQRFVKPIAMGEMACWQAFTEPEGGSDLASLKTRAVKDGDDFIITGQKMWIGDQFEPDMLWCPAVTDPDAPRHQNLGAFLFPANLPGITINDLNLIIDRRKRLISFDGVRVSREYLIGEETQGWRVISTSLELEHGGGGAIRERDKLLDDVIQYCKETVRNGKPLSKDPFVQQALAENYIESNIQRLLGLRNYWMFNSGQQATYHGSQTSFLGKHFNVSKAERLLKILGPYATISDEKWGPLKGRVELNQRDSLVSLHPGGTYDVQKLIIARRLGISRTQERAAPTHASTRSG
ncbi:MAG: acyl-CoA dehydrogenase family protein [Chloroflexi bacterium]|nr:acyl-CoA dehydrogenase family protein [Chloroflexota bacterium]